jgi:hypothetical protein
VHQFHWLLVGHWQNSGRATTQKELSAGGKMILQTCKK